MKGKIDGKLYNVFAIICGTWFLLTSWIWPYFANLVISYPVGLVGIFLWSRGKARNSDSRANPVALWLHISGFVISMMSLAILLLYN